MTLLPVVERELRVGARDRGTYRVRFMGALIPILFSIFSLWFVPTFFNDGPIRPRELFLILTWMEFVFVAIAGFALTCDTISQEKREATLGLLFLTDLKGYDIVLGKLAVALVRGLSALVGAFPVLALPLMLGGTDLAEFSRTSVTLVLVLFLSMTIGLVASAALKRVWSAFGVSGFVMLVLCAGLPAYSEFVRSYYRDASVAHAIELPSPSYALIMSFRTAVGLDGFGSSLGVIGGMALVAVIAATVLTPQVWKDRPAGRGLASVLSWLRALKYGAGEARERFRRRLLEFNPIFWLSRRERVSSFGLLMIIVLLGGIAGAIAGRDWVPREWQDDVMVPFFAWTLCGTIVHVLILLRLSAVAAERFGEDRRSGALELTLSTPLSVKEVLAGHWAGLGRYFAGPVVIAFGIQVLAIYLLLNAMTLNQRNPIGLWQMLNEIVGYIFLGLDVGRDFFFHFSALIGLTLFPVLLLNWIALGWLSTWLSLRTKAALGAPIIALLLLHVPPWLAIGVLSIVIEENRLAPRTGFAEPLFYYALATIIVVAHQLICLRWARRRVYADFRKAATDRYQLQLARRCWWKPWARGDFRGHTAEAQPIRLNPTSL